jgi:hypothetical protein
LDDLVYFSRSLFTKFLKVDQFVSFSFDLLDVLSLLVERGIPHFLERFNMMFVKLKSVAVRSPLDSLDESIGLPCDLFFVCHKSQVDIHIICSESREWRPDSSVNIGVAATRLLLRTIRSLEMINSFQSLVSFDGILQFKLNLGVNRIKFEISFVYLL